MVLGTSLNLGTLREDAVQGGYRGRVVVRWTSIASVREPSGFWAQEKLIVREDPRVEYLILALTKFPSTAIHCLEIEGRGGYLDFGFQEIK